MFDFGMVGLGVMGRNFLLNVADSGFSIIGLDNNPAKAAALQNESEVGEVKGTTSMEEFVKSLITPRKIMLLVPAGKIVDAVIDDLLKFVEPGDLIIDGGNSFFDDTDRRIDFLKPKGINFLGVGVSGGAEGARKGPCIMPGGSRDAYELVRPILEEVAAKVGKNPCVAYTGNGSAGHYVKMVHNGIEYAMMQLLAESYDVLKSVGGTSNSELHKIYAKWNAGRLQSFLVEITADIFSQSDNLADGDLIDKILDKAKQKGTGRWTSQHAMVVGIPVPTIDAAVSMREISALKGQRVDASEMLKVEFNKEPADKDELVAAVEQALLFSFIVSYAQGLNLLATVSDEKSFELDLEATARIWRGGCIIRAALLEDIRQAYSKDPKLDNLLRSPVFTERLLETQLGCRQAVIAATNAGVPVLAISSALGYFDAYRRARLPLNLVQAQRDYFGSHTYERVDREGKFHTDWTTEEARS